mgnify:CR=1 FL=1
MDDAVGKGAKCVVGGSARDGRGYVLTGDDVVKTVRRDEPKVGRNDPCPCGSGLKAKRCHRPG